jgi:hypothetical protein
VLKRVEKKQPFVFSVFGTKPFQEFTRAKRRLDQLSAVTAWRLHDLRRTCVSGMAGSGLRLTWQTKSSITKPARSRGLGPYINGTSSFRSVGRR